MKNFTQIALKEGFYARKQIFCSDPLFRWSHRARFTTARKLLESFPGGKILDYGCGDGTLLALVHDLFDKAYGMDISTDVVENCRKRYEDSNKYFFFTSSDLNSPTFSKRFDVITCMEVLEHCLPDESKEVLDSIERLISPTGKIVISVPVETGFSLIVKHAARMLAAWRNVGDYRAYERYSLSELVHLAFADENTTFERPIYYNMPETKEQPFFCHKGFNWKALNRDLRKRFIVDLTAFSPVNQLGQFLNSQVYFVLSPKKAK